MQYYKKDRDPDVCGHSELPLCYDPDQTRAECHCIYAKDEEWLERNLSDQWFHENAFSFRFFFFKYVPKQFLLDLDDSRLFIQVFMKFSIVS